MKQFFTFVLLVFISVSSKAQTGAVYRLQGTLGSTIDITNNGTGAGGFRNAAIWQLINADGTLGASQSPTTGATLQIFGKTLRVLTNDIDLSAFTFKIQIRSEANGSATAQHVGMLYLFDQSITFATGSGITLGWSIANFSGTNYFYPGYLRLEDNGADIIIGTTAIASTGNVNNTSFYLNANAYNVSSATTTSANYIRATTAPSSTHIMSGVNAPTANISNQVAPLATPYFSTFSYFFNPSAAAGATVFALPVQLISFNAAKANGKVVLTWATAQEINSNYFEVQRSTDAAAWQTITQVNAAGNSGNLRSYKVEDAGTFTGNVYYRIKMVDKDATFTLSSIARLSFAASNGKMFAYPNPATNYTVISSDLSLTGNVKIEVINAVTGVKLLQQALTNPGNTFRLNTSELTTGNYIVKIYSEQNKVQVIKLAKY